ncbi:MAG: TetR/AcrR family transcriptional regulator [Polyangiaceae bacterium]|jgi:AcrR family transcriptional regulator
MSSQKSTAVEPKRARGRARFELILAAASRVFAEQGYDRATMTEIATRSSTAIGSLYRFFPTKEALGEALLKRFTDRLAAAFDEVADRALGLAPPALADALIHALRGSTSDDLRAGTAAVLDGRGDGDELRRDFRARRRKQIARILRIANPSIDPADAQARAAVIVYLLKGEDTLAKEEPAARRRVVAELRRLFTRYVAEALRAPAS